MSRHTCFSQDPAQIDHVFHFSLCSLVGEEEDGHLVKVIVNSHSINQQSCNCLRKIKSLDFTIQSASKSSLIQI